MVERIDKNCMKESQPTFFRKYVEELKGNGFTDPPHQQRTFRFPPITGDFLKNLVTGELWYVPNGISLVKRGMKVDVFRMPDGGCQVRAGDAMVIL